MGEGIVGRPLIITGLTALTPHHVGGGLGCEILYYSIVWSTMTVTKRHLRSSSLLTVFIVLLYCEKSHVGHANPRPKARPPTPRRMYRPNNDSNQC